MSIGQNTITIKTLQKDEWDNILKLSVADGQESFIESAQTCLNDANNNAYDIQWNLYAVYLCDEMIGFAMHGKLKLKPLSLTQVWLDRFMIDARFQGKGFGKSAMNLIIEKLYSDYNCKKIYLSVFPNNSLAISMYMRLGFKKTLFKESTGERIFSRKIKS